MNKIFCERCGKRIVSEESDLIIAFFVKKSEIKDKMELTLCSDCMKDLITKSSYFKRIVIHQEEAIKWLSGE